MNEFRKETDSLGEVNVPTDTESPAQIAEWAPLVMDGRKVIDIQPPAAPAQAAAKRA